MSLPGGKVRLGIPDPPAFQRCRLIVAGRVQGVGFRPFVYRLATQHGLSGTVCNSATGVNIDVQGSPEKLQSFRRCLAVERPPQAVIDRVTVLPLPPAALSEFSIVPSTEGGRSFQIVTPDLAMCSDCRREVHDPFSRRYRYPFTNCTNCGPRYTIVQSLPYDRDRTTMRRFTMCQQCEQEYNDPSNRRFHAQPNACPACGPHATLLTPDGRPIARNNDAVLQSVEAIRAGQIVALKGLGGYQLLVDARSEDAVRRLRLRKARPEKPLAVMYPSMTMLKRHYRVSAPERQWLLSSTAPIVLLPFNHDSKDTPNAPAPTVTSGVGLLGAMLPYTPLHSLLLEDLAFPVVATSGNRSGDPICTDEDEALQRLGDIADLFLTHNRPIVRPVDDSVVRLVDDLPVIIRLGRGLAPAVVPLARSAAPLLAVGGHMKNAFALVAADAIVLSQHTGDLDSPNARRNFCFGIDDVTKLLGITPASISRDAHPEYFSSVHARTIGTRVHLVQHHVAHVMTAVAEHDLHGRVIGFSWDGTGLGEDGTIWGGETFVIDGSCYERVAGLRPFQLPGGEQAVRDPRKAAIGLLHALYGSAFRSMPTPWLELSFTESELELLARMLRRHVNSPFTSSVGRLFDGVAALLGVFSRHSTHEGQAAMTLEAAADGSQEEEPLPFRIVDDRPLQIDWRPMVERLLAHVDRSDGIPNLARRFHATLAEIIASVAIRFEPSAVILSGGCFQNATLLAMSCRRLQRKGLSVYWPQRVPINDGGLAVGQALATIRGLRRKE